MPMTDQNHTIPEREARLIERMAKVFAMLADASYAIADGLPDEAEALLGQLSDAESFCTVAPCVDHRVTDAEAANWKADRAARRAEQAGAR